jgi:hypothetical protein
MKSPAHLQRESEDFPDWRTGDYLHRFVGVSIGKRDWFQVLRGTLRRMLVAHGFDPGRMARGRMRSGASLRMDGGGVRSYTVEGLLLILVRKCALGCI